MTPIRCNVNVEDPHGRRWRNARASIHLPPLSRQDDEGWSANLRVEWVHLADHPGGLRLKVSTSGEETLDVAYGLGRLARHYWALDLYRPGGRQVHLPGFRLEAEVGLTGARWCLGRDDGSWSRDATWADRLRRNHLRWARIGWRRRTDETTDTVQTSIHMPERAYPVTVELHRNVWGLEVGPYRPTRNSKRQLRFWVPGPRRIHWATDISTTEGIPHPGKGENSWDCGQARTYSIWAPRPHPPRGERDRRWAADAVGGLTGSTYQARITHGTGIEDIA